MKRKVNMIELCKALWVLLVLLFGISEAAAAAGGRKVIIAQSAVVVEVLPLWMAKEQKFFDKYGLEAEVVLVKNTPMVVSALVSGDSTWATLEASVSWELRQGELTSKSLRPFIAGGGIDHADEIFVLCFSH
jgi:ABC-type nitrate/sulfonate/bicarbonate transport system substrate-binding protein